MRIINREEFLALPANTVYTKYVPCVFGELAIKGDSIKHDNGVAADFFTQEITNAVDTKSSDEMHKILLCATDFGESFDMEFKSEGRDGTFDIEQLFAVWEKKDIEALINRLNLTLT